MSRAKRTNAGLLLASLTALAACGDARGTSVRLLITADPEVQARASAVRLEVVAGHAPATRTVDETLALEGRGWPLSAVIQPLEGDASRPLEVTLEALDARSRVVARVRAAPVFVPGTVREVELRFEAACLGVLGCRPGSTCVEGQCAPLVTEVLDAGTRHDAGVDAGPSCEERPTYVDRDGDGFGDPAGAIAACEPAAGRVVRAGDCDDACAECRPGARESCEGSRDEDCDARVDEGCECRFGETRECEGGRHVCLRGVQTCLGERWSDCVGRIEARSEECNALDDDCDGRIDEDLRRGCGHHCHSRCELGVWGPCLDRDEACDD